MNMGAAIPEAARGDFPFVSVGQIDVNHEAYLGQRVTVWGEVDEQLGPNTFRVDEGKILDVAGELLVVVPKGAPRPDTLEHETNIAVTGVVQQFVAADFERDYGVLFDDPGIEAEFEARPILIADIVYNRASVSDIDDDAEAYLGNRVTVLGDLTEQLDERTFRLDDPALLGGDDILVFMRDQAMAAAVGDEILVTGEVRAFNREDMADEFGYAWDNAVFEFDDEQWAIRYMVANTGGWLLKDLVLISPRSIRAVDWAAQEVAVNLTRQQLQDAPDISADQPVSRQMEAELTTYYGYEPYWNGPGLWGGAGFPYYAGHVAGHAPAALAATSPRSQGTLPAKEQGDERLRSSREVRGYHIRAHDGEIGHVEDFVCDDESWSIRYLVVEQRICAGMGANVGANPRGAQPIPGSGGQNPLLPAYWRRPAPRSKAGGRCSISIRGGWSSTTPRVIAAPPGT